MSTHDQKRNWRRRTAITFFAGLVIWLTTLFCVVGFNGSSTSILIRNGGFEVFWGDDKSRSWWWWFEAQEACSLLENHFQLRFGTPDLLIDQQMPQWVWTHAAIEDTILPRFWLGWPRNDYRLRYRPSSQARCGSLSIPMIWGVIAPAAVWVFLTLNRRGHPVVGCCSSCGYDLTGNQSRICPECGTATA